MYMLHPCSALSRAIVQKEVKPDEDKKVRDGVRPAS